MATEVANITTGEVARRYGMDASTVRLWIKHGLLKPSFVTPGGHYRFTETDLADFGARRSDLPVSA